MGDRRMAEIVTSDGSIYLYTHWGGLELPQTAANAIRAASKRLGDEPYWVRIVIDQMTADARDKETGWGIMLKPDCEDEYNHDKPSVIIDAKTGRITVIENGEVQ